MAKYYVFQSQKSFIKVDTKSYAVSLKKQREKEGQKVVVFRHVDGIPNPWFCYLVNSDGSYRMKDGEKKVYKHDQVQTYLEMYFE